MKTLKRTTGRSIDPFGNDIFDIIDYYFTSKAAFEKGQEDERKRVYEIVNPTYKESKRENKEDRRKVESKEKYIETLQQQKAKKEKLLKELNKKKTSAASGTAIEVQRDINRLDKQIKEETAELVELKAALKKSTARKEKFEEVLDQMTWAFMDRHGRVLARGASKEDLVRNILAKAEGGGPESERVLGVLKWVEKETGPANPSKTSFGGIVRYSESSEDFNEMLDKTQPRAGKNIPPEKLKRNKLMSLLARPGSEKYIRSPKKK